MGKNIQIRTDLYEIYKYSLKQIFLFDKCSNH